MELAVVKGTVNNSSNRALSFVFASLSLLPTSVTFPANAKTSQFRHVLCPARMNCLQRFEYPSDNRRKNKLQSFQAAAAVWAKPSTIINYDDRDDGDGNDDEGGDDDDCENGGGDVDNWDRGDDGGDRRW